MNKGSTILIVASIIVIGYLMLPSSPEDSKKPAQQTDQQGSQQVSQQQASVITTTNTPQKNLMHTVTLETNKGTIVFETYDADAPKAVQNFITLVNKGYYNGIIFHRVIEGFMIQGGDPTGTGRGGPGYTFADELDPSTASYQKGYVRGTVAMANAGPNTNGSQFFIMHKDTPLPNAYTIFGNVISGIEVVDAIAATEVDGSDRPLEKVVINKATIAKKQ
jgi:cyclophilin family peptidyl-prolyl cis-trans isomerase